ncbi:type II secretion system F family protein [Candidatus Roizmanbacteria bacterium]|nr:type II secretion system F family protein [Candidatus Roizmanbacteria bacterium]
MLFKYKAIKDEKVVDAQIHAENQEAVLRFLKTSNYFPVSIRRLDSPASSLVDFFVNRITFNDIVDFTRQLAIMLNAGLTLIDAIDILKKQTKKQSVLAMLENLDKEIRGGSNFSTALKNYPQYFSGLYIALVKAGEASGKLSDILIKLSDNLEKERTFRAKLRGALIYPALIIVGMVIVAFIMITFVVPRLLELYKDFGAELPLSTKILIAVSTIFSRFWPIIIAITFVAGFLARKYFSTPDGKQFIDRLVLKIPVIGNVIKMAVLVDTTRTLSILISSGVSLLEGLNIIIETSTNVVYGKAFESIKKQVEKGISLGSAMKQTEVFPPILVQMTLVGEQTGHLDDTLARVSSYFETESELAIKAMTTLIEPLILVVLGIGVGFLVFSIITPIYNLTASFK